jgi:hypothetical protein
MLVTISTEETLMKWTSEGRTTMTTTTNHKPLCYNLTTKPGVMEHISVAGAVCWSSSSSTPKKSLSVLSSAVLCDVYSGEVMKAGWPNGAVWCVRFVPPRHLLENARPLLNASTGDVRVSLCLA